MTPLFVLVHAACVFVSLLRKELTNFPFSQGVDRPPTLQLVLRGHLARVTFARFLPSFHHRDVLVTTSADKTIGLWALDTAQLLVHSPVITSAGVHSMAVDPHHPRVALGCGDGCVRIIEVSPREVVPPVVDGGAALPDVFYRVVHTVQVHRDIGRLLSATAASADAAARAALPKVVSRQLAWDKHADGGCGGEVLEDGGASAASDGSELSVSAAVVWCQFMTGPVPSSAPVV